MLGLNLRLVFNFADWPEFAAETKTTYSSAFAVLAAVVIVAALPVMLPSIAELKVLVPAIVSFPVFITAPAAATFVASVTSADASMEVNLVRSASVIIAPDPTLVTSLRTVTLLVV